MRPKRSIAAFAAAKACDSCVTSSATAFQSDLNSNPWDNPTVFQNVPVNPNDAARLQGTFTLVAPIYPDDPYYGTEPFRFGDHDLLSSAQHLPYALQFLPFCWTQEVDLELDSDDVFLACHSAGSTAGGVIAESGDDSRMDEAVLLAEGVANGELCLP